MRTFLRSPWLLAAAIFCVALFARLLQLGASPLSDPEAAWALQALTLLRGQPAAAGANVLYVQATAVFFFLFQDSNFTARIFPALLGSALTLLPLAFRPQLGLRAALLACLFWAFDPGLLALSRQAGSSLAAAGFAALALGQWMRQKPRQAGVWAALALLSGAEAWGAALAALLGLMAWKALSGKNFPQAGTKAWRKAALFGGATLLLAGTFFLFTPSALGGLFRWNFPSAERLPLLALALAPWLYAPLGLGFGVTQMALGLLRRKPVDGFLVAAAGGLLLAGLVWANVTLLAWMQALLWVLASRLLVLLLRPRPQARLETLGMALLTALLLTFAALDFMPVAAGRLDSTTAQMYLLVAFAALFMLAISVALVAQGWNWQVAWQGTLRGGLAALALYSLSLAAFGAGLKTFASFELWQPPARVAQAQALQEAMNALSLAKRGVPRALEVVVVDTQSPSLLWALRDWPLTQAQGFSPDSAPALILTPQEFSSPQLESAYRGAAFRWYDLPLWGQTQPADWLRWSVEHSLPSQPKNLILWARADLFDHESLP